MSDKIEEKVDEILASSEIKKFMEIYDKDDYARYRSYDYVHTVFCEHLKEKMYTYDELALYLYMFLASWGMLRGSTFLLFKDYKFLTEICTIVCDEKYKWLLDVNPFEDGFNKDNYIRDIIDLRNRITGYFQKKKYYKANEKEGVTIDKVSDTLIGKILLATLGCFPAYDNYVVNALRSSGYVGVISRNGINDLLRFTEKHRFDLEQAVALTNSNYPVMKYVDMALWEYGFSKQLKTDSEPDEV